MRIRDFDKPLEPKCVPQVFLGSLLLAIFFSVLSNSPSGLCENQLIPVPSLRTADAFPVVASLPRRERERSDDRKCSSLLASKVTNSHQSPRHIVVQIHHNTGRVSCSTAFSCVDKFCREFDSILNVITASGPLPTLFSLSGVFLVAPTFSAQFAGATRVRYSICHTSWRNGMNKCSFPGS